MPTLIASEADLLERVTDAALDAWWGTPAFLGLHIEGPHLNVARRGPHNPAFIRPFEPQTMELAGRLRAAGIPVMPTLAPECVPAEVITELAGVGVIVSAGHSTARAAEARVGLEAGVSCFTHLYNAMPPMPSRDPGILGAAINSDAYAGIILDGHHVDHGMVAPACRARPRAGCMLWSRIAPSAVPTISSFTVRGSRSGTVRWSMPRARLPGRMSIWSPA